MQSGYVGAKLRPFKLTIALTALAASAAGAQTDVVEIDNGDRLSGTVKGLDRGRLSFSTAATGTIRIEWDDVAYLTAGRRLDIELSNGQRYFGSLQTGDSAGQLRIVTDSGDVVNIPMLQAVAMTPIEESFIDRLNLILSAGYSFTKASDLTQTNVSASLDYRADRNSAGLALSSIVTDDVVRSTQRHTLDLNYFRFLQNRKLAGALIALETNDRLGIDLRTSVRGLAGRYLRQTNQSRIAVYGGVSLNREEIAGLPTSQDSVEAFAALNMEWFRFDSPQLDVTTEFQLLPSLTENGRVRTEADIDLRWEIVSGLFWGLTIYHSFDNQPPGIGATNSDYGIISSLGWSF